MAADTLAPNAEPGGFRVLGPVEVAGWGRAVPLAARQRAARAPRLGAPGAGVRAGVGVVAAVAGGWPGRRVLAAGGGAAV